MKINTWLVCLTTGVIMRTLSAVLTSESEFIADALADEFIIQAGYVTTASDRLANRDDEVAYVSVLDEADRNVYDDGTTAITYEQYTGEHVAMLDDEAPVPAHTVSVEGTLMQVVNYEVLYSMQDRVVNFYTDKQGERRIGSVILRTLASGTPLAYCVKCKASLIYRGEYDRESMEDYVIAVETHGHNHSAKWVTKTVINTPVAVSIANNPALVEAYNDALFDEQVLGAYDTIVTDDSLKRFRRVNGFA